MQHTSALYKDIISSEPHWFEETVVVGYKGSLINELGEKIIVGGFGIDLGVSEPDTGYKKEVLEEIVTTHSLFSKDTPAVGCCVSAEIDVRMLKPLANWHRMAEIIPYIRVCNYEQHSEWIPKGVYYIDTREDSKVPGNVQSRSLHGYDSMLKAEAFYPEPADQKISWSAYEIGTNTAMGYSASYTYTVAEHPHLLDYFGQLVGVTLQYNVETVGMQTGAHPVGYLEFYNGSVLLASATPGWAFVVPNNIATATHIVVYGSTSGAHTWNYTFSNTSDTINAVAMVETIIGEINSNIDGDIGADDIRRLHLLEEDKEKLRSPLYEFPYVASTYTCREVLSMIASAYGGNWWIDDNNNLRLGLLMEYPDETDRLIDQAGYEILVGGDYIDVG